MITRVIHFLISFVLATTALAKLHLLTTDPFADLNTGTSVILLWFAVFAEFAVIWVIASSATPHLKRAVLVVFFSIMTGFSAYNVLIGRASCGCAGAVDLHPIWVLTFDVVIVMFIWAIRPSQSAPNWSGLWRELFERFGGTAAGALIVACAVIVWQSPLVKSYVKSSLGELDVSAEVYGPSIVGDVFSASIRLRNTSNHPVEIIGINKSCHCVQLIGGQRLVPADGEVVFGAQVERRREVSGRGRQRLVFYLDAPRQRVLPVTLFVDWR